MRHADTPPVERQRGPYEITITHATLLATTTVTLAAEANQTRAVRAAKDYLAQSKPGTHAMVHRVTDDGDVLHYHAHLDDDRTIRRIQLTQR